MLNGLNCMILCVCFNTDQYRIDENYSDNSYFKPLVRGYSHAKLFYIGHHIVLSGILF